MEKSFNLNTLNVFYFILIESLPTYLALYNDMLMLVEENIQVCDK